MHKCEDIANHIAAHLTLILILTCQLCGANSFDYLTELQRHAQELAANPAE